MTIYTSINKTQLWQTINSICILNTIHESGICYHGYIVEVEFRQHKTISFINNNGTSSYFDALAGGKNTLVFHKAMIVLQ